MESIGFSLIFEAQGGVRQWACLGGARILGPPNWQFSKNTVHSAQNTAQHWTLSTEHWRPLIHSPRAEARWRIHWSVLKKNSQPWTTMKHQWKIIKTSAELPRHMFSHARSCKPVATLRVFVQSLVQVWGGVESICYHPLHWEDQGAPEDPMCPHGRSLELKTWAKANEHMTNSSKIRTNIFSTECNRMQCTVL